MKELVKAQKGEKEYNDAQVYCEGGNYGAGCSGNVSCGLNCGFISCISHSADDVEDDLLF